jgi:opacity protein-like surface antigen
MGTGSVQPYIGGGGGVMNVEFDDVSDANGPLFDGERTLLVGQLMAGLGFSPSPNTTLYLDYRALFAEDAHFTFAGSQRVEIAGEPFDARYWNQSIMIGVRQSF